MKLFLQIPKKTRNYEIVTWPDVAKEVFAVNPALAEVINDLDPPNNWKIVKVRYAFGDDILRKGELLVPDNDNKLVGIYDPEFSPELKELLNYNSMPVGITLTATMELFADHHDKVIPFSFMLPGKVFALWTALDDETSPFHARVWNMVAGCRSIFSLPKITDSVALKKLSKAFGVNFKIPRTLWEQWFLLKNLAAFEPNPWQLETIYFSHIWLEEGVKQKKLRNFLLNSAWKSTSFLRNDIFFKIIYSYAQAEKNIKIDPYFADTIKHLYCLGCGSYPGFILADSNISAPVDFLQNVFNTTYGLEYSPTLMHLDYLRPDSQKNVFYSLQLPTLLEFSPKAKENATNIEALYYIQAAMKRLQNYVLSERQDMRGQQLYNWAERIHYDYYHSHPSQEHSIQSITNLFTEELILQKEISSFEKPFSETNIFMRGLIKLSNT